MDSLRNRWYLMQIKSFAESSHTTRPTISPDLSGDLRIFPNFQIILYNNFQAAWVKMRRCVTRRLIVNHAVCKYDQIFVHSMHKGEYLSKSPDFS